MKAIAFDGPNKESLHDVPAYEIRNPETTLEIPVFSDVHGDIKGLFRAISALQKLNKRHYPIVLVTGDLGFFPYLTDLDPEQVAREIRSEKNRGINQYFRTDEIYRQYFVEPKGFGKLIAKVFFVRGNHEDQDDLMSFRRSKITTPVNPNDQHEILWYIPDGILFQIRAGSGESLTISALGKRSNG